MRAMTMKPITLVLSLLTISLCALTPDYAVAGLKSSFTGKDYEYDVQGEIYVAPDYAVLPVDIYVAGCPPRPEALINGILALYEKVQGEGITHWA